MKLLTPLLSVLAAAALLGSCSLETWGPGWENEAPEDFAGFQWHGDGDFAKTVSLPEGALAWCHRATGDEPAAMTWTAVSGEFGQAPFDLDYPGGGGTTNAYQVFEVTKAGDFMLEVASSGTHWDAAVTLPVNVCPWDGQ